MSVNGKTHTPGPWMVTAGFDRSTVSSGEPGHGQTVAEVRHPTGLNAHHGQANAYLIAAAPDLLAALEDIVHGTEERNAAGRITRGNNAYRTRAQINAAARAAIAKAKGGE